MVAPIENYADIDGRVAGVRPHEGLADMLVLDIDVDRVAPVPVEGQPGESGTEAFYPNWFEDAAGTRISAAVRRDAPGVDDLVPGSTVRVRLRGAGPGGVFIRPDSLRLEPPGPDAAGEPS